MKQFILNISVFFSILLLSSCSNLFVDDDEPNTPKENFDLLWKIIDENYCFFEYKKINWDHQYNVYSSQIDDKMTDQELFDVMAAMLNELKDGHVNLYSDFDISRYWDWYLNYPPNYDENIVERYYLGDDYRMAGGLSVQSLRDSIGYIRYGDFTSPFDDDNLDFVMDLFKDKKGIIIDIRNNGGGYVYLSDLLASRFTDKQVKVGYTRYKIGPGHDDFSEFIEVNLLPSTSNKRFLKNVVLLTNRYVYSSANDFSVKMSHLPNVTIVGDTTGGGAGLPISSELYNGWGVRYSANPSFNALKEDVEFGIAPDRFVQMDSVAALKNIDSMIEYSIDYLNSSPQ